MDGSWVCIGDFNAILNSSEKLSNTPPQQRLMDDFREALDLAKLIDLGCEGYPFTWNNRRPGQANTKQRLDRVVGNEAWRAKFHLSKVIHLSTYASDHLPIVLHVKCDRKWQRRGRCGFKFEKAWLLWDDCEAVIEEAWCRGGIMPNALETARQKIEACGADLLAWGSSKPHPANEEIKQIQKRIEVLNGGDFNEESKAELLVLSRKLDDLLRKQEIYWAQRSQIPWLKHGDRNMKFFHHKASQRRSRNCIQRIRDAYNNWAENVEDIAGVALDYFQKMFTAGECD